MGEPRRDASHPGPGRPTVLMSEGRRRAAGIYGTIITAAVLAAAGDHLPPLAMAAGVFITLVVYWVAEQYAELLAEPAEAGRLPTWPRIRAGLANTWPMVTACYLPVLVLLLARVLHVDAPMAANLALAAAVILLLVHGRAAGRAAGLHGRQAGVAMLVTGGLGALMIVLKDFVLVVLH